jgi:hypothetical protein
MLIEAHEYKNC